MASRRVTLGVAVVLMTLAQALCQNCPYGWYPQSQWCFYFTQNSATTLWENARLKCQAFGGDLAQITSTAQLHFFNATMHKLSARSHGHYTHWWIGLNRKGDGSTWTWADGSNAQMGILPWANKSYVHDKTKACVNMHLYQMEVDSCTSASYQSICQRPRGLPIKCDTNHGWISSEGKCYKYFNTGRTWNDASSSCDKLGATLPIINDLTSQTINAEFARFAHGNLWTGLRSQSKGNSFAWVWQDGTTLAGNPYWRPSQPPAKFNANNTCVELTNNQLPSTWVAASCGAKNKYYCQRPEGTCADGWLEYGTECYLFNPHYSLSWPSASTYCKGLGGNLASLQTKGIQAFINQYLSTQNAVGVTELWIGLTDNNKDGGPWVFTNGAEVGTNSFKNWNSAKPSNSKGHQDCGYIVTSDRNGKWHVSSDCTHVRSFICQIPTDTPVKQITHPPNSFSCPRHWVNHGQYCYYFNEQDMTYASASDWCISKSGQSNCNLVKIPDSRTQGFISSKVQHHGDYWIGLNDQTTEGWWQWQGDTHNATYTQWIKGQPDNLQKGNENCVVMYATKTPEQNGLWHDFSCSAKFNFICQAKAVNAYVSPPPTTPKPWSTKCGAFWESDPSTPYCYQFSDQQLTWYDADSTCKAHGGRLASIEASEESYFITGRIRGKLSADYWIGANDLGTEGGWRWADNKPFGYLNWNAGEPNNYGNNEDCAAVLSSTGRWHDTVCTERRGYICKKSVYYQCDIGWMEFEHNCYKFNKAKNTWQSARNWCKHQHGDLVKISNTDTLGFINDHIDTSADWWIGLNDLKQEGGFVWLDDKAPSGVIQWKPGEPNQKGNEDCVAMLMTYGAALYGKYNDYACSSKLNYVCAKPGSKIGATSLPQTTSPKSVPAGYSYHCPQNWQNYRGSCYYFARHTGSWSNSVTQCGYQGAKLASIIDDGENKMVYSIIPKSLANHGHFVWIGLNDQAIEMKFVWQDGQPVSYTHWARNEPNNWMGHDEDCVAMSADHPYWQDRVCSQSLSGAVCKKPMTIIPKSQLELGTGCQGAQMGYHATCYDFQWSSKTWRDAEKACRANNGHLATITGSHVQAFLGAEMLNKPTAFWVGLNDHQNPGTYQWSSGQVLDFTAWYETHTGNERKTCVAIRTGHPAGLWENHNCTDHRPYICEYPRTGYTTLPTQPPTTPSPLPCPKYWHGYNDLCYRFYGGKAFTLQTWTEARDLCQGFGGDLVSIYNSTLESFIQTIVRNGTRSFWIGLNDRDIEDGYQWTDGTPFAYSNWAKGEPNNLNAQEDCVEYNFVSNSWNDFYCYTAKHFMCQLPRGIQITTTPTPPAASTSTLCKGNGTWYFYNNRCYMLSPRNGSDAHKSWFESQRYCMAAGGDLASIHSPDDNGLFTSLIARTFRRQQYWIGLNNLDMSGYQWSDGSPVQFLDWQVRQPNDGLGEKRCVYLDNHFGTWYDQNCNDVMGFICQKKTWNTAPMTPAPTAVVQGGCPPGFKTVFSSHRCYMVSGTVKAQHLNWTSANAKCQSTAPGATLAIVSTKLENRFLTTLLRGISGQVWIGLMDRATNGRYMWVDSSEVLYTAWAPGQPDEDITDDKIEHRRDCVMVWTLPKGKFQAGGWDDYFCDAKRAYACSVPKIPSYPSPTQNNAGCSNGYINYGHSCYKGYTSTKQWSDAQLACVADGGNLVSINDAFEASFVDLMVARQGQSWIGLNNLEGNGHFTWTDKYPVQLTRWAYKEPSTSDGEGCVVEKRNFRWNNTLCANLNNYICEIHLDSGPVTTAAIQGFCPDSSWSAGADYCYKIMTNVTKSWPEARYLCQRMGAELASISSQAVMTEVTGIAGQSATDIWIGLSKTEDGGFVWTDRSPVSYLHWAHNEPSDTDNEWHQDCVIMMASGGWQWNDLDCFTQAGYICKIMKSTSTVATKLGTTQSGGVTPQNAYTPYHNGKTPFNPNTPFNPVVTPAGNTFQPSYTGTATPHNSKVNQVSNSSSSSSGMSGGAIAGILIGVIALIVLVVIAFLLARKKYKFLPNMPSLGFENAMYDRDKEEVSMSSKNPGSGLFGAEEDC
ncbi:macrophage mannose receptor 1-like [Haliotis rufescens]|uniref:macrophage mannose receptor 1-like n=1 Tax=Haliotis rufescens TaxID=6454 RepID=UPI00201F40B1|nr:macrophage mannose receptor 1-like [Haliotis rufescens]